MALHTVSYGDRLIAFSLVRHGNLKDKIKVVVEPDGDVQVHAPADNTIGQIKRALLKRARWICTQVSQAENQVRDVPPRRYVSGETHWYLGKRYLLKVRISQSQPAGAKLLRGMLWVTVPEYRQDRVKATLDAWYLGRAREVFQRQLELIYPTLPWVKQLPPWQLRAMHKQWGSCSPRGRLALNPLLVKAPRVCIDYVITHELCHLRHHNHSKHFYRLLNRHVPLWQEIKGRLDGLAASIGDPLHW